MDEIIAILGGFVVTWVQVGLLYYKVGKLEGKINGCNKKNRKEK